MEAEGADAVEEEGGLGGEAAERVGVGGVGLEEGEMGRGVWGGGPGEGLGEFGGGAAGESEGFEGGVGGIEEFQSFSEDVFAGEA